MSENNKNIAYAKAKSIKTSLNKVNLVLRMIRGKKAENIKLTNQDVLDEMIQNLEILIQNIEKKQQLSIDS